MCVWAPASNGGDFCISSLRPYRVQFTSFPKNDPKRPIRIQFVSFPKCLLKSGGPLPRPRKTFFRKKLWSERITSVSPKQIAAFGRTKNNLKIQKIAQTRKTLERPWKGGSQIDPTDIVMLASSGLSHCRSVRLRLLLLRQKGREGVCSYRRGGVWMCVAPASGRSVCEIRASSTEWKSCLRVTLASTTGRGVCVCVFVCVAPTSNEGTSAFHP